MTNLLVSRSSSLLLCVPLVEESAKNYSNTTWFELAQLVRWYAVDFSNTVMPSKISWSRGTKVPLTKAKLREELRELVPLSNRTMSTYVTQDNAMWRPDRITIDGHTNFFFPMAEEIFTGIITKWRRENYSYAQMNRSLQIITYFCCNCLRHKNGFCHSIRQVRMDLGNIRAEELYRTFNDILFGMDLMRTTMRGFKWTNGESASSRYILNKLALAPGFREILFADIWGFLPEERNNNDDEGTNN